MDYAAQHGVIVGIDTAWVYPIAALLPMVVSAAFGSALYGFTWLVIVSVLDAVALFVLARAPADRRVVVARVPGRSRASVSRSDRCSHCASRHPRSDLAEPPPGGRGRTAGVRRLDEGVAGGDPAGSRHRAAGPRKDRGRRVRHDDRRARLRAAGGKRCQRVQLPDPADRSRPAARGTRQHVLGVGFRAPHRLEPDLLRPRHPHLAGDGSGHRARRHLDDAASRSRRPRA